MRPNSLAHDFPPIPTYCSIAWNKRCNLNTHGHTNKMGLVANACLHVKSARLFPVELSSLLLIANQHPSLLISLYERVRHKTHSVPNTAPSVEWTDNDLLNSTPQPGSKPKTSMTQVTDRFSDTQFNIQIQIVSCWSIHTLLTWAYSKHSYLHQLSPLSCRGLTKEEIISPCFHWKRAFHME